MSDIFYVDEDEEVKPNILQEDIFIANRLIEKGTPYIVEDADEV
jgi:hypothetical protein